MALRFIEGFDHYASNPNVVQKGWTNPGGGVPQTTGRFGGNAINMGGRTLIKVIDAQSEWIVGAAYKNASAVDGPFIQFRNGSTNNVELYHNSSTGLLSVRRGGSTTLATGTTIVTVNVWYYIEVRVKFSDTVGEVEVYVNGVQDINYGPGDTVQSGAAQADRFYIGDGGITNISTHIDDMYFLDTTGSAPYDTFLGDCRVEVIYPNGNGNSSQFDGSDGNSTDNYLLVDETSPDSDTTYTQSAVLGEKDTYAMGNLATSTGTVFAVQPAMWARKTDAGARSVCSVARLSGVEEDSADNSLGTGYTYYTDLRTEKPGGGAWTIADVNSTEFGMKVTV